MIDINTQKERLHSDLATVTKELADLGIHNPAVASDWVATPEGVGSESADPNVEADVAEDWTERRAVLAELETRYNNLTRALTKIDDGTYGTCEVCSETIEADRLDANPAARTCVAHRDDEEHLPR